MEGVEDRNEHLHAPAQSSTHIPCATWCSCKLVLHKYRYRQQGTTVWSLIRIWLLRVQQSAFGLGATVILTGKVQASFKQQNGAC
jgi:hypothetical protein